MPARRRFLSYTAVLVVASFSSWLTYNRLNRKPPVPANCAGLSVGHLLHDGKLFSPPSCGYECNMLILGGGAVGLGVL